MCTWQGEQFVAEQLRSIRSQTRLPEQVVVVDDDSRDATWQVLEREATTLRGAGVEVVLRRQPANVGYVRNFETALGLVTGDIVFLCDQDDHWHPDKVERFLARFDARPDLLMLHSDARLVDAAGAPLAHTLFEAFEIGPREIAMEQGGRAFEVLMGRNTVTGAAAALRRNLIDLALPIAPGWIHDEWLAVVAAAHDGLDCLDLVTTDYRQHGANQVGARRRGIVERITGGTVTRGEFLRRMLTRLAALQQRVDAGSIALDAGKAEMLEQRIRHAEVRAGLPARMLPRIGRVVREVATGRYHRFSSGLRSIASDLTGLRR